MPEVEPLMRVVRELATNLLTSCRAALDEGVPIERVQDYYFRRTSNLFDEAEAQAILAVEGSTEAVTAIEACLEDLVGLAADLARDRRQATGDESDA